MKRIYLDHNATTPTAPCVLEAMLPYLRGAFGNPSSLHWFGQEALRALDQAREEVAALIGASPGEIVFTSGGTESINQALLGIPDCRGIVTSPIEHQAVLNTCRRLARRGVPVRQVPVDAEGRIDLEALEALLDEGEVSLVSIMLANNEIGVIQPLAEVVDAAHRRGILVHTDAVQAVGKIPVDVRELGVDLLSCSAHKIQGPKGLGALFIRDGVELEPLLTGGHQERRRRAGTENVPGIVGFGRACRLAGERLVAESEGLRARRDAFEQELLARIPEARINGSGAPRVPNTTNVTLPGTDGDLLMMSLDVAGVAVSTGSACSVGTGDPSHVLLAMGRSEAEARASLRISLGWETTEEELHEALERLEQVFRTLAAL